MLGQLPPTSPVFALSLVANFASLKDVKESPAPPPGKKDFRKILILENL